MVDKTEQKAKQLYLAGGWTYAALAKKFKVSERTIIRWAKAGSWQTSKDAEAIASQALAEEVSEELAKPVSPKSVRSAMKGLGRKEVFEIAKAYLSSAAPDAEIKSMEAAFGQLIKVMQVEQQMEYADRMADLEYKLKETDLAIKQQQLNPPTLKAWVDKAIGDFRYTVPQLLEELYRLAEEEKNR
jgi:transcriptional regulator with XRE-family HTH domain